MDQFDRASQLEERDRERAINLVLKNARKSSREECIDCDEPILAARQKVGGIIRCINCQTQEEKR
ncbi:MAG: TraR/DksA C4-type zinc finger protein [Cycloclasticus sp.]|jgi:Prokaryotic dksA/traR C4-type zinc finger.